MFSAGLAIGQPLLPFSRGFPTGDLKVGLDLFAPSNHIPLGKSRGYAFFHSRVKDATLAGPEKHVGQNVPWKANNCTERIRTAQNGAHLLEPRSVACLITTNEPKRTPPLFGGGGGGGGGGNYHGTSDLARVQGRLFPMSHPKSKTQLLVFA